MLHEEISSIVLGSLSNAGVTPKDSKVLDFYGSSIKSLIGDKRILDSFDADEKKIKISVKSDIYKNCLISEVKKEISRVERQKKTTEDLINIDDANIAWCIVSAYYYCFFSANELSKLFGSHQINLNSDDIENILVDYQQLKQTYIGSDSNINFRCSVKHGENKDTCLIELEKYSPKPHKNVWDNFSQIVIKSKIENNLKEKNIFSRALNRRDNWPNPSDVRNKWNYSDPKYFSSFGIENGYSFKELIKNKKKALAWANTNHIYPDEKNQASLIAYMFHTLSDSYKVVIDRLNIKHI